MAQETLQRFVFDPLLATAIFAVAIVWASVLLRVSDRFGVRLVPLATSGSLKFTSLEGLRGVLALAVVAHHLCCWYFLLQTGQWNTGGSILFDRLASFGVAQFFYLSGFLFWRKLMRASNLSLRRFYLSRFVRIAPVYYACGCAALFLAFATAGFPFDQPIRTILLALLPWLLFSLGGQPNVFHASVARISGGVSWTLGLEMLFYLSLPLLAWFSRRARRLILLAAIFAALHFVAVHIDLLPAAIRNVASASLAEDGPLNSLSLMLRTYAKFMLIGFGGGILIAAFEPRIAALKRIPIRWRNGMLITFYAAYLLIPGIAGPGLVMGQITVQIPTQILLLAGFALVVQGFDLLNRRTIRFLGVISYPIYLLHGMVFFAAWQLRSGLHPIRLASFSLQSAACLAAILILAALLHRRIERPTMLLAERIAQSPATTRSSHPELTTQTSA